MIQPREIPVYLFTGFLESGKTTFIQETLEDPAFNEGQKTLLLVCEEGRNRVIRRLKFCIFQCKNCDG